MYWTSWILQAFEKCPQHPRWSGASTNSCPMPSHRKAPRCTSYVWEPKVVLTEAVNPHGRVLVHTLPQALASHRPHAGVHLLQKGLCTQRRFVLRADFQMGTFRYRDCYCLHWAGAVLSTAKTRVKWQQGWVKMLLLTHHFPDQPLPQHWCSAVCFALDFFHVFSGLSKCQFVNTNDWSGNTLSSSSNTHIHTIIFYLIVIVKLHLSLPVTDDRRNVTVDFMITSPLHIPQNNRNIENNSAFSTSLCRNVVTVEQCLHRNKTFSWNTE